MKYFLYLDLIPLFSNSFGEKHGTKELKSGRNGVKNFRPEKIKMVTGRTS